MTNRISYFSFIVTEDHAIIRTESRIKFNMNCIKIKENKLNYVAYVRCLL